jgi:hypothetical protein
VSLVQNEQVKLTATYLNGLAIAIFAVGGLAPVVGVVSGDGANDSRRNRHCHDRLRLRQRRPTSCRERHLEGAEAVTWAQIASLYIAPVGAVIIAAGLYYFTGPPADRRRGRSSH